MAKSKAAKAGAAAAAVKESQYIQRVIEDEDLRDNIVEAYASLRDAYDRLSNGKSPAKALLDDKKLQKDLKKATDNLREARHGLTGDNKKGGFGRKLLLLVVGGAVALAVSEGLRKKVLDALFGAEEEFEYTSVTSPSGGASSGGTSTQSSTASTSSSTSS